MRFKVLIGVAFVVAGSGSAYGQCECSTILNAIANDTDDIVAAVGAIQTYNLSMRDDLSDINLVMPDIWSDVGGIETHLQELRDSMHLYMFRSFGTQMPWLMAIYNDLELMKASALNLEGMIEDADFSLGWGQDVLTELGWLSTINSSLVSNTSIIAGRVNQIYTRLGFMETDLGLVVTNTASIASAIATMEQAIIDLEATVDDGLIDPVTGVARVEKLRLDLASWLTSDGENGWLQALHEAMVEPTSGYSYLQLIYDELRGESTNQPNPADVPEYMAEQPSWDTLLNDPSYEAGLEVYEDPNQKLDDYLDDNVSEWSETWEPWPSDFGGAGLGQEPPVWVIDFDPSTIVGYSTTPWSFEVDFELYAPVRSMVHAAILFWVAYGSAMLVWEELRRYG